MGTLAFFLIKVIGSWGFLSLFLKILVDLWGYCGIVPINVCGSLWVLWFCSNQQWWLFVGTLALSRSVLVVLSEYSSRLEVFY